jgi:DNA-binding NtrC family response regulator
MISPTRDFRGHIVIADDDRNALNRMRELISAQGFRAVCASSRQHLIECLDAQQPAAIVLDYDLERRDSDDSHGTALLEDTCRRASDTPVIVVSSTHSLRQAVVAMQHGAAEYLTKPLNEDELLAAVERAVDRSPAHPPALRPAHASLVDRILGNSPAIEQVRQLIHEVASTDASALVIGESGTGKELVARAIHSESNRRQHAFVPVNMAALPSGLVESVLFGHAKGAFTGAEAEHQGCCTQANNGTLFLDEISEMDVTLQAKLLRFLQDQTFQRVGASQLNEVDVRIVAAANQDPTDLVASGRLRDDLYYRLNVFPIEIPPLRCRLDDVPVLANHFLATASLNHSKDTRQFSDDALEALSRYTWPGNIRQLENLIQRLVIRSRNTTIEIDALPTEVLADRPLARFSTALPDPDPTSPQPVETGENQNLRTMDYIEKNAIIDALTKSRGNVVSAARMLGLGQATVYRKIKRDGISLADPRQNGHTSDQAQSERRA